MQDKLTKSLIVIAALIIDFLMPYLSRIPLGLMRGADWFWNYMPDSEIINTLIEFHLFSLKMSLVFGIIFIFTKLKWGFYAAAFGHFAATIFFYSSFEEAGKMDATFELLAFPFLIFIVSLYFGLTGLIAELIVNRRKSKFQMNVENVYE